MDKQKFIDIVGYFIFIFINFLFLIGLLLVVDNYSEEDFNNYKKEQIEFNKILIKYNIKDEDKNKINNYINKIIINGYVIDENNRKTNLNITKKPYIFVPVVVH